MRHAVPSGVPPHPHSPHHKGGGYCLPRAIAKACRHPSLDTKAKTKIVLRILYKPLRVARIERMLDEQGLAFITRRHPRLYEKPSRPYLASGLSTADKVDLLGGHYRTLSGFFSAASIEAMYTERLPLLSSFLPEMEAEVDLRYESLMEKEGELTLWLSLGGSPVFSVTFVLHPRALYIGSLQGNKSSQEGIRSFTKMSHGVRPQSFVIFLLRLLARRLGLPTILAVNNQAHIYQVKKRTQERVRFDYDAFWRENGGAPAGPQFFELPLQQPRKDLAEVAANKRAQYRRRYEFLDTCADALERKLDSLRSIP